MGRKEGVDEKTRFANRDLWTVRLQHLRQLRYDFGNLIDMVRKKLFVPPAGKFTIVHLFPTTIIENVECPIW